jgi:hypothetical protein
MDEALRSTQEAALDRDDPALAPFRGEEVELFEVLAHDGLDAFDVEELEGERSLTGLLQAVDAEAVDESQELLGLADLGPGQLACEQRLHEAADLGPQVLSLADQALGRAFDS